MLVPLEPFSFWNEKMLVNLNKIFTCFLLSFLLMFSAAVKASECSFCFDQKENTKFSCEHHYCKDCLPNWVKDYLENKRDLSDFISKGLPCRLCNGRIAYPAIKPLLPADVNSFVDRRLAEMKSGEQASEARIEALKVAIEDASALTCPACKDKILDRTEACNKATCSNQKCKAQFCMYCFAIDNSEGMHAHVASHQGNLFEQDSLDDYHWVAYRKKLDVIFQLYYPKEIAAAVARSERYLVAAEMWPLPVRKSTQTWLDEIRDNRSLRSDQKVKLVEREGVYRFEEKDGPACAKIAEFLTPVGGSFKHTFDRSPQGQPAPALRREPAPVFRQPVVQQPAVPMYYRTLIANAIYAQRYRLNSNQLREALEEVYRASLRAALNPDEPVHLVPRDALIREQQHLFAQSIIDPSNELLFYTESEGNRAAERHVVVFVRQLFLTDDMRQALQEAQQACDRINNRQEDRIDLFPQANGIRQLQHLLATQNGLRSVSEDNGFDSRYVVIRRL